MAAVVERGTCQRCGGEQRQVIRVETRDKKQESALCVICFGCVIRHNTFWQKRKEGRKGAQGYPDSTR